MAFSDKLKRALRYAFGVEGQVSADELEAAVLSIPVGDIPLASGHIIVGSAGGIGTDVAMSGDIGISNAGVTAIGAGKVTNAMVAPAALDGTVAKVVANVNVIGGIEVIHRATATLLTGDVDIVLTHKTRITNVRCISVGAGGAADTITVKNGAMAITDAIDMNVADKAVKLAGTIDTAQWDIAAAGTLRISGASAVNCEVLVYGIRVA